MNRRAILGGVSGSFVIGTIGGGVGRGDLDVGHDARLPVERRKAFLCSPR